MQAEFNRLGSGEGRSDAHADWSWARLRRAAVGLPEERAVDSAAYVTSLSPSDLLDLLSKLQGPALDAAQSELRDRLLARLAFVLPSRAVAFAEQWPDPESRDHVLRIVTDNWIQRNVLGTLEWLVGSQHKSLLEDVGPRINLQLEGVDVEGAATFVASLPPGDERNNFLGTLVNRWGHSNFDAALVWTGGLPDGSLRERMLLHLAPHWIERNPGQALAYAQSLPAEYSQLLTVLTSQWVARDPQAAAGWAVQLPEGPQRTTTISSLVAAWAQEAPVEALRFACSLPPGEAGNGAITSAVSGWANRDPLGAMQWVSQLPLETLRDEAITQAMAAWIRRDAASAAEWLAGMPEIPGRDAAVSCFSGSIVDRYPAVALIFAQTITSEPVRIERIENVARRWLAADEKGASAAIARSDLPRAMIMRLLPPR